MDTYIDSGGTERCDDCDEGVDDCLCTCPECGDGLHRECACQGEGQ